MTFGDLLARAAELKAAHRARAAGLPSAPPGGVVLVGAVVLAAMVWFLLLRKR